MDNTLDYQEDIKNLASEDPSIRRMVAEKYQYETITDEIAQALTEKITDQDIGVRDAVATALILSENNKIAEIVVPFIASEEISTRNLAGEILLKRGLSSVPAMVNYLPKGNDDDDKFIIDLLGLIGDNSTGPEILKVLERTKNDNVILACLEAMGNIKYEEGVPAIIQKYDENENFTPTVIEALGKIGSEESLSFILDKYQYVDELTKFSMIESIGLIGNPQAFYLLLSELRNMKGALTWAAIESLDKLKDKFQLDVPFDENMKNSILNTLIDGEKKHKKAAANLITAFEDREIIEA